jgi:hypothetical protein
MTLRARRALAIFFATLTFFVLTIWTWLGSRYLFGFAWRHLSIGGPVSAAGGGRPDPYDSGAKLCYIALLLSLLVASAAIVAVITLQIAPKFHRRGILYVLLLCLLLPSTAYNYAQNDVVLRPAAQAGLNIVLVFLASTVVLWLAKTNATSPDTQVLKYLALFLISAAGIAVPLFLTTIWFFALIHLITLQQSRTIGMPEVAAVSAVFGTFITFLNYRRELRKDAVAQRETSGTQL